jgi:predicted dehydrogenase
VPVSRRAVIAAGASAAFAQEPHRPLRLAIAGLVHGHATGFLRNLVKRGDVELVGIAEPDTSLHAVYGKRFDLPPDRFHRDLEAMLDSAKPEAVGTFTNTFDHAAVVEACAGRRIHVMMEKPLAVSIQHAKAIAQAAARGSIHVLVNYETTWYPTHAAQWRIFRQAGDAGEIRRMVAADGHQGPKEIGVGPEFLAWLTDPVKNGAGALFDFGCYGANLMTWLMDNQRPVSVTARTLRIKPHIYGRVDDEATVLVEYPKATGVIEASWNWPFNRKDFEVYAERGYAHAFGPRVLRSRMPADKEESDVEPPPLPADERDPVSYLRAVVRGRLKPSGLNSLANNLVVTEILDAARRSAETGRTVRL